MSLSSSLTASTNGLLAQSTAISNISGNLANTSTTAYKTTDTSFADLVTTTATTTSSGTTGVTASAAYNNSSQGTITSSDTTTYMAVNGSGYFAVKTATVNADGSLNFSTDTYYTRCGDFTANSDGYMENSEGYYLLGWSVNSTTGVADTTSLTPVNVTASTNAAVATSKITYSANLPASASDSTTTSASTVSVYDSTGTTHDVSYTWTKTDTNTWTLNISATGGAYDSTTASANNYASAISVTFDTSGNIENINTGDGYSVDGSKISFDLTYDGAATQTISCDLSSVTQYAGTSISVSTFTQNGVASGSYSSTSIDSSGNVSINYSNGQSVTTYEVPIATFVSEDNLARISGNAYQATLASGNATYNVAGSSGAGKISSSSLESSDVDIATQFTDMITSQQVYSANAKVISTVNEMMKTLIQLQ